MNTEPVLHLVDRVQSLDKEFHVFLATCGEYAPQVRVKTFIVSDEEPRLKLMHTTKWRLRAAVRLADAIHAANALHHTLEADVSATVSA